MCCYRGGAGVGLERPLRHFLPSLLRVIEVSDQSLRKEANQCDDFRCLCCGLCRASGLGCGLGALVSPSNRKRPDFTPSPYSRSPVPSPPRTPLSHTLHFITCLRSVFLSPSFLFFFCATRNKRHLSLSPVRDLRTTFDAKFCFLNDVLPSFQQPPHCTSSTPIYRSIASLGVAWLRTPPFFRRLTTHHHVASARVLASLVFLRSPRAIRITVPTCCLPLSLSISAPCCDGMFRSHLPKWFVVLLPPDPLETPSPSLFYVFFCPSSSGKCVP